MSVLLNPCSILESVPSPDRKEPQLRPPDDLIGAELAGGGVRREYDSAIQKQLTFGERKRVGRLNGRHKAGRAVNRDLESVDFEILDIIPPQESREVHDRVNQLRRFPVCGVGFGNRSVQRAGYVKLHIAQVEHCHRGQSEKFRLASAGAGICPP